MGTSASKAASNDAGGRWLPPSAAGPLAPRDAAAVPDIWVPEPPPAAPPPAAAAQTEVSRLLRVLENLNSSECVLDVLLGFIDERCCSSSELFADDQEHSLECTALHAEYCQLFEGILEDVLSRSHPCIYESSEM